MSNSYKIKEINNLKPSTLQIHKKITHKILKIKREDWIIFNYLNIDLSILTKTNKYLN